jgi:hypothetical protein
LKKIWFNFTIKPIKAMKNFVKSLIFSSIIFSCDKNDAINVDLDIFITLENQAGVDLLNPQSPNPIKEEGIKIFYEINGVRETYQSTNEGTILDNPDGFTIYPPDGSFNGNYYINLFSNPIEGIATTIIEVLGHNDIVLTTEVSGADGGRMIKKIWFNNDLVWPIDNNNIGPAYVRIVL